MFPTICKLVANSFASLDTTAKLPDAAAICSKVNGTFPANLTKLSNAFFPSSTEPNKKKNLNLNCSTSLPTFKNDLTTRPAPIPSIAD